MSPSPSSSALSADAWRQTGPAELPGNKHHLKGTECYSAALEGGKLSACRWGNSLPASAISSFYKRLMHSHTAVRAGGYYCRSLTQARFLTRATAENKEERKLLLLTRRLTFPGLKTRESACHADAGCKSPQASESLQDLTPEKHPFSPDSHNKPEIAPFRGAVNQSRVVKWLNVSALKRKDDR